MRMLPQKFQNRRARTGDLSRLPAQTARQRGHFLAFMRMFVCAGFHQARK
jgi:hypothetical protein